MFIRFIHICIPLFGTLCGCDSPSPVTPKTYNAPIDVNCAELSLKPSKLSKADFEQLQRKPPPVTPISNGLNEVLVAIASSDGTSSIPRLALQRAALEFAQQTTLSHFMQYGRLLALSAINNLSVKTSPGQGTQLNAKAIRTVLSAVVGSTPPPNHFKTREDKMLRYILYMWSWSRLLSHRVQLSQWWRSWEYRWLLEAQVLGHFGLNVAARIEANSALTATEGYASSWNTAVLHLWAHRPLSNQMKHTLSTSIPRHCLPAPK